MKKVILFFALVVSVATSALSQVVVSGDIASNTTWTKNNTYLLSGFVYVTNGATLTIEPGTVIKGEKASKGTLIITRGSKIIADGTASEPVVFTSAEATPSYGDWGGLIVLGYAPTNISYNGVAGIGLIEGGIDPVKGIYGGGDQPNGAVSTDNSGILRYVRVEYPGIAFQPNNEINGITFGGVGSGTVVDYVQVSYAADDAFEWFGGTVNCRHLVAYRALDDDFDTDFGFAGKVQFGLVVRDPQVADVSGSNGFEADNDANGSGNAPKSKATFSNITVVGPSGTVNSNYKRAAHLRRNTENAIFNSVLVGSYPVGLFIDGDSCANNATSSKLIVRNSFFTGMTTPLSTNAANGFNITNWAADKAIVASNNSADAKLVDPFNINLPNPRPQPGSPVLTAASFSSDARIQDNFFTPVSYAGAFGPTGDWTCPWASWTTPGCIPAPTPNQVLVSTDITQNTTWTADNEYTLQGFIYVSNCATLTIQPGTVIKGDKGSKGALIVTRCSKLVADGTVDAPIVFTTNDPNPTYGSWGGLIILGNAPTNQTYNGTAGLGLIEGGLDPNKALYGGNDANDNSGVLRYVRVEYPGIAFQPNNEINGITFGAVGAGTTVDHVQVSFAGDDAYEWFGGTVNCKHLIAYRALDDDFDADNGYKGNVQYALSVRDPQVADVSGSNGFEIDNDASGSATTPKTAPTFSNVTLVGPTGTINANYKRAAHLRRNSEPAIFNSLLLGSYPVGIFVDGATTTTNASSGLLEVKNTQVHGPVDPLSANPTTFDVDAWFATSGWGNAINASATGANLQDAFNLDFPNAQPTGISSALNASSFGAARLNNSFFDNVSYVGAFGGGAGSDWTCGWAKFKELNNNCFVGTEEVAVYINDVKLFPTVANDQVTLQLNMVKSADLSVEIYGMNGQYFGNQINEKVFEGAQQFTLNTSTLPRGFYFVRIQAGNAVTTEKLIIAR